MLSWLLISDISVSIIFPKNPASVDWDVGNLIELGFYSCKLL